MNATIIFLSVYFSFGVCCCFVATIIIIFTCCIHIIIVGFGTLSHEHAPSSRSSVYVVCHLSLLFIIFQIILLAPLSLAVLCLPVLIGFFFFYSLLKKFPISPPALPFHLCYKVFSEVSIKLLTVVVIAPENKGTTVLLQLKALFSLRSLCFTQWCSSWTILNLSALWAFLTFFFQEISDSPKTTHPPLSHDSQGKTIGRIVFNRKAEHQNKTIRVFPAWEWSAPRQGPWYNAPTGVSKLLLLFVCLSKCE